MDVCELLSYKPEQTPKRNLGEDTEDEPARKTRKTTTDSSKTRKSKKDATSNPSLISKFSHADIEPEMSEQDKLNILQYVNEEEVSGTVLDETELKKIILLFEKRNLRNQEMRIKFPDNPEKFMESEIDLHTIIQEMKIVATVPDMYPLLVELNAIPSILELLAHSNTDISVTVVELLEELTDIDILNESADGANILFESLRKQQFCALLVQNLDRLDETVKEEATGVHKTLAIFEYLIELKPEMSTEAAEQGLLQWILKRLKLKSPFDGNKLYCSEILSILVQDNKNNRLLLGLLDGIDILLQQLAVYKRHDPSLTEEQEFMENLFNCLCSVLLAKENHSRFLHAEGLQLMNLMLREKKLSRNGSLKVLDYAMSGPDGRDNCNKFIDILGLRTIFPLFMKTPKRNKKSQLSTEEHEEHVVSIIASMLRNCNGPQRQRLHSKFLENDYEKVDRLLELYLKFLARSESFEMELDNEIIAEDDQNSDIIYIKRLAGGLFTLQLIAHIILEICAFSDSVKQRVVHILKLRGASMTKIRHVMREYAGNLGMGDDNNWRHQEQAHILQLVDRF